MHERSEQILHALVREFIASGEPVSSGWLFDHHNFGIRSAMIRSELSELTEQGFLEQPHHSAGRVPTDIAYQMFAEEALEHQAAMARDQVLRQYLANQEWELLLEKLSQNLGILGALHRQVEQEVYKEGLETLINHLDWHSRNELTQVIRDFEALDDRVEEVADGFEEGQSPKVFIGKKSPVTNSEQLSVMMHGYDVNGEQVMLFAIGPKRMDYEKIARILKGLEPPQIHG